jgi:hypothetical protein
MDTIRGERSAEAAEAQIDAFIERRSRKGEMGPDEREDLWVESVRRFNEQQRRQIRAEWCEYHRAAAERARRTLAALIAHHEDEAEKLLEPEVPDDAA